MTKIKIYFISVFSRLVTQSFNLRCGADFDKPLDRVWGILFPDFGMYLAKVEDTATRTKSIDKTALIIFIG